MPCIQLFLELWRLVQVISHTLEWCVCQWLGEVPRSRLCLFKIHSSDCEGFFTVHLFSSGLAETAKSYCYSTVKLKQRFPRSGASRSNKDQPALLRNFSPGYPEKIGVARGLWVGRGSQYS